MNAIEFIKKYDEENGTSWSDSNIEMAKAFEAYHEDKTRWIECSERLPEMGYIVSTYSKYYGVNNAVWIQKGVWKSNVNNQEYQGVTHWQPLPTPPKINAE